MINVTQAEYDFPKSIPNSYFHGRASKVAIPTFQDWQKNHHIHFLRYLWYLLDQNFNNVYPSGNQSGISYEDLQKEIDDLEKKIEGQLSSSNGIRPIKKILIGEAPPPGNNYFYDNTTLTGPWINAPWKACYHSLGKPNQKSNYLIKMAQAGFLLLDLFPYAISFTNRDTIKYETSCISAFRNGPSFYPINIMATLCKLQNQINLTSSIAFGMKKFGEAILNNKSGCVLNFNRCTSKNGFGLHPAGPIDCLRTPPPNPLAISNYLRIISDTSGNPNATLLIDAGF